MNIAEDSTKQAFREWVKKQEEYFMPKYGTAFSTPLALYLQEELGTEDIAVTMEDVRIKDEVYPASPWIVKLQKKINTEVNEQRWNVGTISRGEILKWVT